MKKVSVFCGSSSGKDGVYRKQARLLGQTLAKRNIELIYGGAAVGLMGEVADGALENGGEVTGILPQFLKSKKIDHQGLTRLIIVKDMHERKTMMSDMSDGVIALPGGFGTLEEFFEMLTWGQLGLHRKPVAILNIDGFYNSLNELLQTMVEKGFLKQGNKDMLIISEDIDDLLDRMENYSAPLIEKWID